MAFIVPFFAITIIGLDFWLLYENKTPSVIGMVVFSLGILTFTVSFFQLLCMMRQYAYIEFHSEVKSLLL